MRESSLPAMYTRQRRSSTSWTTAFLLILRRIQMSCGIAVIGFSIVNSMFYEQAVNRVSVACTIAIKIAAWSSLATAILATIGLYTNEREREYTRSLLVVGSAALLSSTIAAACLTAVASTYWWSKTELWIAAVAFAWTGMVTSLILFLRAVWCRRHNKVELPTTTTHEPTEQIDAWRYAVEQEYSPLIGNVAPSQVSIAPYAESEYQDFPSRPGSPISTVAGWTTISETATITQFSEAPPPYTPARTVVHSIA